MAQDDYAAGWDRLFGKGRKRKAKPATRAKRKPPPRVVRRVKVRDPDTVRRMRAAQDRPPLGTPPPLPHVSQALGVHPEQVPEAREHARQHGLPGEFLPNGDIRFTTHRDFERHCKFYGYYNRR